MPVGRGKDVCKEIETHGERETDKSCKAVKMRKVNKRGGSLAG